MKVSRRFKWVVDSYKFWRVIIFRKEGFTLNLCWKFFRLNFSRSSILRYGKNTHLLEIIHEEQSAHKSDENINLQSV